jgi:hypothetical protein
MNAFSTPRRNGRSAPCEVCGELVAADAGYLYGPPWTVKCKPCSGVYVAPASIRITLEGKQIAIRTVGRLGDQFNAYRAAIEGAKYAGDEINLAPMDKAAGIVTRLHEGGFFLDLDPAVIPAIHDAVGSNRAAVAAASANAKVVDAILREKGLSLYPFQGDGSSWLASRVSAVLADEMGLGKTLQTLIALPAGARAVVICPAVAKGVWQREAARWRPDLHVTVLSGLGSFRWPEKDGDVLVTNYDILRASVQEIVTVREQPVTDPAILPRHVHDVQEGDVVSLLQDMPDGLFALCRQTKTGWTTQSVYPRMDEALSNFRYAVLDRTSSRAVAIRLTGTTRNLVHSEEGQGELTADAAAALSTGLRALVTFARRHQPKPTADVASGFTVLVESRREGDSDFSTLARWNEQTRLSLDPESRRVAMPKGAVAVRVTWSVRGEPQTFGIGFKPRRAWTSPPPAGTIIIGDEAQKVKNPKAERTTLMRALCDEVRQEKGRSWGLTATPMENKATELWSVLQCFGCAQEAFGGWKAFARMMGGSEGNFGMEWGGEISDEVPGRLQRVMLRRIRTQVLPQLPVKRYQTVPVDIDATTKRLCDKAETFLRTQGIDIHGTVTAAQLSRFDSPAFEEISAARAALATAKIAAMLETVESYEEQEEKLVVFSAHRAPIDLLAKREGWAVITGSTPNEERSAIEDKFQRGELKGVACTIQAGGVAITLTRSAHSLFVDRAWNPAANSQAEDRICRIGQSRGCLIRTLTADHALDQRINEVLEEKTALIDATVEASSRIDAPALETEVTIDLSQIAADAKVRLAEMAEGRANALRIAAERAANAKAMKEENEKKAKEREDRERAEKKERAARERARARGWVAEENDPTRRGPQGPQEEWASRALQTLSALDPDHAKFENEVGFNKADGPQGHFLGLEIRMGVGLTPAQWTMAIQLCRKYHGQVGRCPAKTADAATEVAS